MMGLAEAVQELERKHVPVIGPGRDVCLTCPVLLSGEIMGGRLYSLCLRCLERRNEAKTEEATGNV